MITLAYAESGDWVGIYIDGKLVAQGHSFESDDILRYAGVEHATVQSIDCDQFGNRMPDELAELDAQVELGNATFGIWKPS